MSKLMIPTILAIFFWPTWSPPPSFALTTEDCNEIRQVLLESVSEDFLTLQEAQDIYEGCGEFLERQK